MSNSTQNKFRDFVENPDPKVVQDIADKSEKRWQETANSTQNDMPKWSKRLQEAYDKGYEKGLADARREVIEKVEKIPVVDSSGLCDLIAKDDVLATLREEKGNEQMKHWGYGKGIEQTAVKAEGNALTLDKLNES